MKIDERPHLQQQQRTHEMTGESCMLNAELLDAGRMGSLLS